MENRITILNELQEISSLVAGIGPGLPFQVPQGYFEEFALMVLVKIATEQKLGADPFLNICKDNIYELPNGYFEGLADAILNRVKASEAYNVKEELNLLSPVLGQLDKNSPFTTPDGYFSELSHNVVSGVQAIEFVNEELENLSPMMGSLKGKVVYLVPEGYFEQFPTTVLNTLRHPSAKVISLSFSRRVIRYAVAAAVIGVLALVTWIMVPHAGNSGIEVAGTGTDTELKQKVKSVSDAEILNYTDDNSVALADATSATGAAIGEKDAKDLLADVSDEELQHYLEEHGGTTNANTN